MLGKGHPEHPSLLDSGPLTAADFTADRYNSVVRAEMFLMAMTDGRGLPCVAGKDGRFRVRCTYDSSAALLSLLSALDNRQGRGRAGRKTAQDGEALPALYRLSTHHPSQPGADEVTGHCTPFFFHTCSGEVDVILNIDLENTMFEDVIENGHVPPGASEEDSEIAKYLPASDVATSLDVFFHHQFVGGWRDYSNM